MSVYQATYANTPVYEMFIRNAPVIRRQDDAWVNATQLLRAGGIERPTRSHVMDKFVLSESDYRRVQGGFGKFQGTWVPLPIAIGLAREVNVFDELQPLLQPDPSSIAVTRNSSPASVSASASALHKPYASAHGNQSSSRRNRSRPSAAAAAAPVPSPQPAHLFRTASPMPGNFTSYFPPTMSTPLPRGPTSRLSIPGMSIAPISPPGLSPAPSLPPSYPGPYNPTALPVAGPEMAYRSSSVAPPPAAPADYPSYALQASAPDKPSDTAALREAIVAAGEGGRDGGETHVPTLPSVGDINVPLDAGRNTALHYAAAYGLAGTVKELLARGAAASTRNAQGQTALMMMCRTHYASERDTFPVLFLELARWPPAHKLTRFALAWAHDNEGNTLLHHIALLAADQPEVAGTYLRPLLAALKQDASAAAAEPDAQLATLLNYQNAAGQTALHIVLQHQQYDLAQNLLHAGADPTLPDLHGSVPATALPDQASAPALAS